MTTLRLLADLLLIAPRLALAWLKTKLPHSPAPVRHCQSCGWRLSEQETSLLCGVCHDDQRRRRETR